jgi:hypothetical protein
MLSAGLSQVGGSPVCDFEQKQPGHPIGTWHNLGTTEDR